MLVEGTPHGFKQDNGAAARFHTLVKHAIC
jgi:hypothetical protein